jgi:hypothetical protein
MMQSPSEQIADFLGVLPLSLYCMICVPALLLAVAFVYFAFIKPRRNLRAEREAAGLPVARRSSPAFGFSAVRAAAPADDMPDLDMLVDIAPPAPTAIVPSPRRVRLNTGESIDADPVIMVLRGQSDGRLLVQIDDTAYRSLADPSAARDRFLRVMRELSEVINKTEAGTASTTEPPVDLAASVTTPAPAPMPRPPVKAVPLPPSPTGIPGDLPSLKLDDNPPQLVKGSLFSRPKYEAPPAPELNVAGAIEAYLQHRMRANGDFAGRNIHVHPAPDGGVMIEVDGRFYESVGDVADDEVRTYLSQTIEEWQNRQ